MAAPVSVWSTETPGTTEPSTAAPPVKVATTDRHHPGMPFVRLLETLPCREPSFWGIVLAVVLVLILVHLSVRLGQIHAALVRIQHFP